MDTRGDFVASNSDSINTPNFIDQNKCIRCPMLSLIKNRECICNRSDCYCYELINLSSFPREKINNLFDDILNLEERLLLFTPFNASTVFTLEPIIRLNIVAVTLILYNCISNVANWPKKFNCNFYKFYADIITSYNGPLIDNDKYLVQYYAYLLNIYSDEKHSNICIQNYIDYIYEAYYCTPDDLMVGALTSLNIKNE